MHELSLAMNMVDQIEQVMVREGAQKLISVKVEIGALSGVEREPMAFCFPAAIRGTTLDGAELHIEDVPLKLSVGEKVPHRIAVVALWAHTRS